MSIEELKRQAARRAVEEVEDGMVLGLGTGSTTAFVLERLGELLRSGKLSKVVGVPTSERTAEQARTLGIPLSTLKQHPAVDLAIDGADEVDPNLDLIKGLGGALLREKMVECVATRFVVVVDHSKLVERLGARCPVPVEVSPQNWRDSAEWLSTLGCDPVLRGGEQPYLTDGENNLLDCDFSGGIVDPQAIARTLDEDPRVLAHGLFLGMADQVVVAQPAGIRVLSRVTA